MSSVLERARPDVRATAAPRGKPIPWGSLLVHALLIACIAVVAFPLYFAFVVSTQDLQQVVQRPPRLLPSTHLLENYAEAWRKANMGRMLFNSAVMAVTVAVGKIVISMLSAFAIVYFDFRGRMLCFWMIFVTLMLPVPVRLMSTYEVVGTLGWLNTYQGLTIPLIASATATFLFRQFYLTIPSEMAEAAQLDGAGPLRFLFAFLLPLSWANIAALFVVLFIFGWNQYLWPLLVTIDDVPVGTTPLSRPVRPGKHKVHVAQTGYADAAPVWVEVPPNGAVEHRPRLYEIPARDRPNRSASEGTGTNVQIVR